MLLVECRALGPTLLRLSAAPGIRDVAVFGDALHVLIGRRG